MGIMEPTEAAARKGVEQAPLLSFFLQIRFSIWLTPIAVGPGVFKQP